jgi:ethanolamine ammonia-lyase large subunit
MDPEELRQALVVANAFKEGDLLVGGTSDDRLRGEARHLLLAARVADMRRTVLVHDGVTAALARSRDHSHDADLDRLTIGGLKATLLAPGAAAWVRAHRDALPSEVIAAVAKCMNDDELSAVARTIFNPLPGSGVTIGSPHHFGSRIRSLRRCRGSAGPAGRPTRTLHRTGGRSSWDQG